MNACVSVPNAIAMNRNCPSAAVRPIRIHARFPRAAPSSAKILCASAIDRARMRAKCPSSGIIGKVLLSAVGAVGARRCLSWLLHRLHRPGDLPDAEARLDNRQPNDRLMLVSRTADD